MRHHASSLTALAASAAALSLAPRANADMITLFNTGVDGVGVPLPGGSLDPHWSIIAGPDITSPIPATVLSNQQGGNYAQSADSRWIWVHANGIGATGTPYTFQLTFDLTGFIPSTATISGSWGVDNDGSIRLNGIVPAGTGLTLGGGDAHSNYMSFHSFQIDGGFVEGLNTLEFEAVDLGIIGGLNINHLVGSAAPLPEPSSALCLLGLLGLIRRR